MAETEPPTAMPDAPAAEADAETKDSDETTTLYIKGVGAYDS